MIENNNLYEMVIENYMKKIYKEVKKRLIEFDKEVVRTIMETCKND